jgi:choline dehydrogenase
MGIDERAVVDPQTRVHGIKNLRVVDSSIFPTIPNGNLNAPTIMVAERAADLIRGKEPLQSLDAPVVMDEQWQARQRPREAKRQQS